jgi:hypothetical protein
LPLGIPLLFTYSSHTRKAYTVNQKSTINAASSLLRGDRQF